MALDTVATATANPETTQPFAELGLKPDEYARIKEILGRRPTSSELAMYSVMWSEHCSYKSSKVHLKQFGEKAPKSDALLVGIGENAGVVDVGQGYAVTFKIESHNHPSFVEPYQGAATGIGGIVRDILTMGARPIAVMDPLRFGPADAPDTRRVLPGIIAGVGGYGNCLGLPNIGGEVTFDEKEKPGISNLLTIHSSLSGTSIADLENQFAGKGYGDFKTAVAEVVVEHFRPIRAKAMELLEDEKHLIDLLHNGAEKARKVASQTLSDTYKNLGLVK